MRNRRFSIALGLVCLALAGCAGPAVHETGGHAVESSHDPLLGKYTSVRLTADLAGLTDGERQMIPLLIEAAKAMDDIFWIQAYGDKEALLASLSDDDQRRFAEINYGPWDRLDGNAPFVDGVGPKPEGANFYPPDMTKEELEAACEGDVVKMAMFRSQYTLIRRGDGISAHIFRQ